nr:hypothetical protein KK1_037827 [Ipomoea trifida]
MTRFPVLSMKRIPDVPLTGLSLLATQTTSFSGIFRYQSPTYRLPMEFPGVKKPRARRNSNIPPSVNSLISIKSPYQVTHPVPPPSVNSLISIKSPYQVTHPVPPSLILALAYAHEQLLRQSSPHPSSPMVVFTAAISVSGIFMCSNFKNPSPLRHTSVCVPESFNITIVYTEDGSRIQYSSENSSSFSVKVKTCVPDRITGFLVLDDEISGGVDEEDSGCAIDGVVSVGHPNDHLFWYVLVPKSDVSLADGFPGGEETESAEHEQLLRQSSRHSSSPMVVFTAVIVSGIFMFSSFKNPSPLRHTSVAFLQHPCLQSLFDLGLNPETHLQENPAESQMPKAPQ